MPYKIIRKDRLNRMLSEVMNNRAVAQYYEGYPTMAPFWLQQRDHHLLAFDTLNNALKHWDNMDKPGFELWLCKGVGQVPLRQRMKVLQLDMNMKLVPDNDWEQGVVSYKIITLKEMIARGVIPQEPKP